MLLQLFHIVLLMYFFFYLLLFLIVFYIFILSKYLCSVIFYSILFYSIVNIYDISEQQNTNSKMIYTYIILDQQYIIDMVPRTFSTNNSINTFGRELNAKKCVNIHKYIAAIRQMTERSRHNTF